MKVLVIAALCVAVCCATNNTNPVISRDFVANITLNEAGLTYHGYIVSDYTGHRSFKYVKELNESTYTFQLFGQATTFQYTIMNSGCTCQKTLGGEITDYFQSLVTATPSTKACNATSGTLYVNNWLPLLPAVPQNSFCVDGTTPKYYVDNSRTITFSNFVAGRPAAFPLEPMYSWQDICNNACL